MQANIKKILFNIKNFGLLFGIEFFLFKTIFRKYEWKMRKKSIKTIESKIRLDKTKYLHQQPDYSYDECKKIFVFWWTGFENAPQLVKRNVKKLQALFDSYQIILLDKNNFSDYVSIDENIMSLFSKNRISIQTFSDILRFQLLLEHGGFWFDSTIRIYKFEDFAKHLQNNEVYSLNVECDEKTRLWGKVLPDMKYVTFFIGARKGSNIMQFLTDMYKAYYKHYDFCIDYFMNDYFLIIAKRYGMADYALDKIPAHQGNPFYLSNAIEKGENIDYNICMKCPQKLNWRNKKHNAFE